MSKAHFVSTHCLLIFIKRWKNCILESVVSVEHRSTAAVWTPEIPSPKPCAAPSELLPIAPFPLPPTPSPSVGLSRDFVSWARVKVRVGAKFSVR